MNSCCIDKMFKIIFRLWTFLALFVLELFFCFLINNYFFPVSCKIYIGVHHAFIKLHTKTQCLSQPFTTSTYNFILVSLSNWLAGQYTSKSVLNTHLTVLSLFKYMYMFLYSFFYTLYLLLTFSWNKHYIYMYICIL